MPVTRWLVVPVLLTGLLACDAEKDRRDRDDDDNGGEGGDDARAGFGGTSGNGGRGGGIAAGARGGSVEAAGESGSGDPGAGGSAATGGTGIQASGGDDAGGNGATGGMEGGDGGTDSGTGGDAGSAATGGSSGASGGSSGDAGTAGTGNVAGAGGTGGSSCGALIDDMEAGTGYVCQDAVRTGSWFSYHGTSSTLEPGGEPVPTSMLSTARSGSTRAMRVHGTNGDYSGFGCWLTTVPTTYDASAYTGLRFWAMGTPSTISLVVQTSATTATEYGGTCSLATLSCAGNSTSISSLEASTWQEYSIPFSSLSGGTASFDRADIWSIEFQSPQGSGAYDIWIDDLRFY